MSLEIEIDLCAAKAHLSEDVFKKNWPNNKLKLVSNNFRFLDGSTLQTIGEFKASVSVKKSSIQYF